MIYPAVGWGGAEAARAHPLCLSASNASQATGTTTSGTSLLGLLTNFETG
jgi:hypothetical protein